jgi:hypothetical protein
MRQMEKRLRELMTDRNHLDMSIKDDTGTYDDTHEEKHKVEY